MFPRCVEASCEEKRYSKVRLFFEFDLLHLSYIDVVPGRGRTAFFLSVVEPLDLWNRKLEVNVLFTRYKSVSLIQGSLGK